VAVAVDLVVHSRPIARRLVSGASVLAPVRWDRLRGPVLAALIMVLAAEAVGQTAVVLRARGKFHTHSFLQREVAERVEGEGISRIETARR
jgi:hypothetical protein